MPSWIVKAAVQGAISHLPHAHRINELFQRYVTRSLDLTESLFLRKWRQGGEHIEHFEAMGRDFAEATVVELGTGWYPIVPVTLAMHGAAEVISIDRDPLTTPARTLATVRTAHRFLQSGRIRVPNRTAAMRRLERAMAATPQGVLDALGMQTWQVDARTTGLSSGAVDLFVSNNTLEHIPQPVLGEILAEFRRVAAPHAIMSHFVDMADHYAGFDRSINVYNYLRFGDRAWSLFNNKLQYQNRLRLSEYRSLHTDNGWSLMEERHGVMPLDTLRTVPLSPRFQRYDEEDLRVYEAWMVSAPN